MKLQSLEPEPEVAAERREFETLKPKLRKS